MIRPHNRLFTNRLAQSVIRNTKPSFYAQPLQVRAIQRDGTWCFLAQPLQVRAIQRDGASCFLVQTE